MGKFLTYEFNNKNLLEMALTHRSADSKNNERLEFLGDAILSFIISCQLYDQFPHLQEGELSRIRANLVNEDALAEIAKKLNLGEHVRLGSGELKSGGNRRKSILADTFEALIGAIYLDSTINICQEWVLNLFSDRLNDKDLAKLDTLKDPKSRLQEYLQSTKMPLPIYSILSVTGESHNQHFHVRCEIEGISYRAEGVGSSRRAAEQMAAEDFLTWMLATRKA